MSDSDQQRLEAVWEECHRWQERAGQAQAQAHSLRQELDQIAAGIRKTDAYPPSAWKQLEKQRDEARQWAIRFRNQLAQLTTGAAVLPPDMPGWLIQEETT